MGLLLPPARLGNALETVALVTGVCLVALHDATHGALCLNCTNG